jgi:[ribosomal protein S18]-alanine N-acetyltransferase
VSDERQSGQVDFTIREMRVSDALATHEILAESPEAANWTEHAIRSSLTSSHALAFVSVIEREIRGCVLGASAEGEAEILNLAVKPLYRRRGIASCLVKHILAEWQRKDVQRIYLEVRESNVGAINFYEGMGFQRVGRRKRYYAEPEEDALVLERQCRE